MTAQVLLGVTGGIAAYKTAIVASRLVQQGCQVQVVLTAAAEQFVGRATFAALTGRPVLQAPLDPDRYPLGPHIELADGAELLCVAPATANFLAKAAGGLADDLLSTLYLSFTGPVLMAPAMNAEMWLKPAVERNVRQLVDDGVEIIEPEAGWLSCRRSGPGRMADPERIIQRIAARLERQSEPAEQPQTGSPGRRP